MRRPPALFALWLLVLASLPVSVSARRAIVAAELTNGALNDTVDATAFTLAAAVTPTADRLNLVWILSSAGALPNTPTVTSNSGLNCTWTVVTTITFNPVATPLYKLSVFRCLHASPGTGTVTYDFGGQTQTSCTVMTIDVSGVDTGGTNGSAAVVQSATAQGDANTTLTATLAAFASASNGAMAAFASDTSGGITAGSGWTGFSSQTGASPGRSTKVQWRNDNDTSADATWSSADAGGIALEIAVPSAGATPCLRGLLGVGCEVLR